MKLSIASSYLKLLLPLLIAFHVAVHTQKYVVDGSLEETTTVIHDLVKKHTPRPSQTLIFVSTFSLMVLLHLFNGLLRMTSRRTVVLWYASLKGQQAQEGGLPQDRKQTVIKSGRQTDRHWVFRLGSERWIPTSLMDTLMA